MGAIQDSGNVRRSHGAKADPALRRFHLDQRLYGEMAAAAGADDPAASGGEGVGQGVCSQGDGGAVT
jgi:hypothetical protein